MYEIREIPFLEGLYATSDGRILDSEFNEVNKSISRWYYRIWYNGKDWYIHRLIAITFIPNPENKECVHHINHNKLDNRVENLMWLTNKEHNILHNIGKHHTEEAKRKMSEGRKGDKNPNWGKKASEETKRKQREAHKGKIPKANPPKPVYQYTLDGKLVKIWPSASEAGRNGYDVCKISLCCNGKRKTHKGYIWSYVPL